MYNIEFKVNGELTESGTMSVEDIDIIKSYIEKKSIPFWFDKGQITRIITEYLGVSEDYYDTIDITQLREDIRFVIAKYKTSNRKIQYILESDLQYATDNYNYEEDIEILENVNGIIVYKEIV